MIKNRMKIQSNFSRNFLQQSRNDRKKKQKNVKKKLKSIANMIDRQEISIKKLLLNQTIILSTLHLFQLFFHFRDETKRFINAFRKFRKKKIEKINQTTVKRMSRKQITKREYLI